MKYALTETKAKNVKPADKAYKLTDGGGLYLFVSPTGAKSWRYKYRIAGKEHLFSIGPYPELGLKVARTEHQKARELVAQQTHPKHYRDTQALKKISDAENTFEAVAKVLPRV